MVGRAAGFAINGDKAKYMKINTNRTTNRMQQIKLENYNTVCP